jgi:hypothetical protein
LNFQGWMKSEQGAPICTWITRQLMKIIQHFKIWGNFLTFA